MAVSRITINHGNIRTFMQGSPLAGSKVGAGRGFGHGDVHALAARMAAAARSNAATYFVVRTERLVNSVVPIVRVFGRGAGTEVGVGTTVEHGKWLELGLMHPGFQPRLARYRWMSDAVRSVIPTARVRVRELK